MVGMGEVSCELGGDRGCATDGVVSGDATWAIGLEMAGLAYGWLWPT